MNKKLKSLIFISIFFLFAANFVSSAEMTHPGNINLDLSGFARNINLTADNSENAYFCVINLKFKKNIPLKDDTVTVFLKLASNFSCEKIKCEFISDEKIIASDYLVNNITKAKNFDSSVALLLSSDLGNINQIKLSFDNIDVKKPWIQLKEAKLPKKEKPEASKMQKEKPESSKKQKEKSAKNKKNKDVNDDENNEIKDIEDNVSEQHDDEITETVVEDIVEEVNTKVDTEVDENNVDIEDDSIDSDENATSVKKDKSEKRGFLAWLESLFSKKGKKLPKDIQAYIKTIEKNQDSLYICTVSKNKKVSPTSGPFNTKEQVILVWIYKNLPENNKYAVSNNDIYLSDSPSTFFDESYKEVTEYIEAYGMEEAFRKYFSSNSSTEQSSIKDVENQKEKIIITQNTQTEENKDENLLPVTDDIEEQIVDETPFFELPLNNDSKSSYSQYEREYLQDYAPKKKLELPKETISERTIENPDEADSFGRTLLMKAAQSGNNWEMKSLLASGANVNLKDNDGWTALMYAIRYQENISIVETLINAGAKIKIKNKYDLSPLIIAASYNGNPEITKKILSYYSVSEKEVLQAFVLMLSDNSSSDFAKLAKIEEFLYKSIPLNTFYNGKTPLMYAAQYSDSTKILNCLLEAGAITSIRSTEGKTAFDYAQENKLLAHDDYYWALNRK